MAEPLSTCAKEFINFLTGKYRQQLRTLLQTYKQLISIELASLVAKITRMDIIAQTFQAELQALETLLRPLESQMAQLPLGEFKNCIQIASTFGNIENIYFEKKAEYTDFLYKTAQFTFASAHVANLQIKLENQLDFVDSMILYIDNVAALDLLPSDPVYVYTSEEDSSGNTYPLTRTGTIDSVSATSVDVLMDDTGGIETFNATSIQPR